MGSLQTHFPNLSREAGCSIPSLAHHVVRSDLTKVLVVGTGVLVSMISGFAAELLYIACDIRQEPLYLALNEMRKLGFPRRERLLKHPRKVYRYLEKVERILDQALLGKQSADSSYLIWRLDTCKLFWLAERTQRNYQDTKIRKLIMEVAQTSTRSMNLTLLRTALAIIEILQPPMPWLFYEEDLKELLASFRRVRSLVQAAKEEARRTRANAVDQILAATRHYPVFGYEAKQRK